MTADLATTTDASVSEAAELVLARWEHGDLAEAMRELQAAVERESEPVALDVEQMRVALLTAKALFEEPLNNPRLRDDGTKYRADALLAEVYACVCQGLRR